MDFYSLIYYFVVICKYTFILLDAFIVLFSFRSFTKTVFGQCALKTLLPFRNCCFHFITGEKHVCRCFYNSVVDSS